MLSLKNVDEALHNVFDGTRIQLMEAVYEKPEEGDFLKLVFSLHNLDVEVSDEENTIIAHTKFIFKTNEKKTKLIENSFWYLYDINCEYKQIEFGDTIDELTEELEKILFANSFGNNLRSISEFISVAPASSMNDYLYKKDISTFSITLIAYNPKFKIFPCEETQFDFDIFLNNDYEIRLEIKKDEDKFEFFYKAMGEITTSEYNNLNKLPQKIASDVINLMENILS